MVVARPGTSPMDLATVADSLGAALAPRIVEIAMPQIDLRSRELRRRRANGQSIRFQTPRAVEQYIASHDLYAS
jgi:nicotinate-nucleotide adenylyltransferase